MDTCLVCATHGLRANLRQADVVELSFLHQFVERLGVVLDLVIGVAPRGDEQIELLGAAQSLEDGVDAPAQVLLAPVRRELAREGPTLDGEERALGVLGILLKEARKEVKVGRAQGRSVKLG